MPEATARKSANAKSRLKRAVYDMPDFIAEALRTHALQEAYDARPPYQRNDYVGWITRAKLDATRQKRLAQMIDELKGGTLYMNMAWSPKVSPKA